MERGLFLLILAVAAALGIVTGLESRARNGVAVDDLQALLPKAVTWIEETRHRHREQARPLDETELRRMTPFFPREVLDGARIRQVPGLKNPEFLGDLGAAPDGGLLFDVTTASALAVVDTVLAVDSRVQMGTEGWYELLFHELVHLTQYRRLGTEAFVTTYVESMVEVEFRYPEIAHEAQAFALQRRFAENPAIPFSVGEEVRQRFGL